MAALMRFTITGDVPAGTTTPCHAIQSNPGTALATGGDGRVSLKAESKSKFYIQTTTKFDMDKIKEELIDFAFSFMGAEGISGVSIKELNPKQLVVYADLQDGVTINGEKQKG